MYVGSFICQVVLIYRIYVAFNILNNGNLTLLILITVLNKDDGQEGDLNVGID